MKNSADALYGAGEVGSPAPENDGAMALQGARRLHRAESDSVAADNDHDRIVRLRHQLLPLTPLGREGKRGGCPPGPR
jgi:hypothetical protein